MRIIVALAVLLFPFSLLADGYAPFNAKYDVAHKGQTLGSGFYRLKPCGKNRFCMRYKTKITWLLLSDIRSESTEFILKERQLLPFKYTMSRKGTGPDFKAEIRFRHGSESVEASYKDRKATLEWQPPMFDYLLHQQQLRIDISEGKKELSYPVVYKTSLREYNYQIIGEERVKLPMGQFNTVVVERIRSGNSNKTTKIWFAPELNHIVARMAHYENGELKADLQLREVKFN